MVLLDPNSIAHVHYNASTDSCKIHYPHEQQQHIYGDYADDNKNFGPFADVDEAFEFERYLERIRAHNFCDSRVTNQTRVNYKLIVYISNSIRPSWPTFFFPLIVSILIIFLELSTFFIVVIL